MKISSDVIGKQNHKLPAFVALPQISALLRDLLQKTDTGFLFFVQPNIYYRVHNGQPLASVLLSISAVHILTSHSFKIHINIIVQSTHITSKWCLGFRNTN